MVLSIILRVFREVNLIYKIVVDDPFAGDVEAAQLRSVLDAIRG